MRRPETAWTVAPDRRTGPRRSGGQGATAPGPPLAGGRSQTHGDQSGPDTERGSGRGPAPNLRGDHPGRRHPLHGPDGVRDGRPARADARGRGQFPRDQEPAHPSRPGGHQVRRHQPPVHRPDGDRLFAGPGGGGQGADVLDVDGVKALASLPSLDELRGRLVGLLNAPATKLAGVLQAPAGQVARVLGARGAEAA